MKKNTVKGFMLALSLGLSFNSVAQTPEQRDRIKSEYDVEKLHEMALHYGDKAKKDKAEALELAVANGWPVRVVSEDGAVKELMRIENGQPVYYTTYNRVSAIMMNVDDINSGGSAGLELDGQGMIIGEWDGGAVRKFHQDLTGRVIQKDGANEVDNHATHVAGTMIGSGEGNSQAKGMASQATLWANDWDSDLSEMTNQAIDGLLISNHSYGRDVETVTTQQFGAYGGDANAWDNLTYNAKYYQPVVAAGNDRDADPAANPTKNGRDLLFDQATAKNVIVVGAVEPGTSAMSSFSNWGPTDDNRIKPDIVAKGVGVTSTWGTSNTAYESIQGTSMASPGIAGSLLLWQQYFDEQNGDSGDFMRSATLRALMAHTAEDLGVTGPDYKFGWGILNALAGANVITNNGATSAIIESSLANNGTFTQTVTANGVEPLVVTLAWTDRAHTPISGTDSSTPALVNDLDIRVSGGTNIYKPWRLNTSFFSGPAEHEDNTVDNIEKVILYDAMGVPFIPAEDQEYTITVTHKGALFQSIAQEFSVIVTGIGEFVAGVDENNFVKGISMWPNPANDVLNVSFINTLDNLNVVIYDIQGRQVASKKITAVDNAVNIDGLGAGVYIVEFSNGSLKTSKKLIKQ